MTVNSNLEAAWTYHNATKHSYASVHNNLHFLDWANQPLPFKAYTVLACFIRERSLVQGYVTIGLLRWGAEYNRCKEIIE